MDSYLGCIYEQGIPQPSQHDGFISVKPRNWFLHTLKLMIQQGIYGQPMVEPPPIGQPFRTAPVKTPQVKASGVGAPRLERAKR